MGKHQEELTNYFNGLSKKELYEMLEQETIKYAVIKSSCDVVRDLMKEYNVLFTPLHQTFIRDYLILIVCAKRRGLPFPKELMQYDIDNEDVLERLMEQESIKVKQLDNYIASYQNDHIGKVPVEREVYVKSIGKVFDDLTEKAEKLDLTRPYKKRKKR